MNQILQKGENVSLTKIAPKCNELTVVVQWFKKIGDETEFDIDASAFMLTSADKVRRDEDFIFYNQQSSFDNAIELINSQEYNSQKFNIVLGNIQADINKISVVLTIHEAKAREQNFGLLELVSIKILSSDGIELLSYVLQDSKIETALILSELYRYNEEWKFRAIGQGYEDGLEILAKNYGVDIDSNSTTETIQDSISINPSKTPATINYTQEIQAHINYFADKAKVAKNEHFNEAKTRKEVIDGVLEKILSYQPYHIEVEKQILNKPLKVDYLITLKNKAVMVIEAKKINQKLGDKHVSQAVNYAHHLKINFALLTNGVDWQLYYVRPEKYKKYVYHHVFSIDLLKFDENMAENLFLISRTGIEKEKSFEAIKSKILALNTIHNDVLFSDEIMEKIASILNEKNPEYTVNVNEVRNVIKGNKLGWLG